MCLTVDNTSTEEREYKDKENTMGDSAYDAKLKGVAKYYNGGEDMTKTPADKAPDQGEEARRKNANDLASKYADQDAEYQRKKRAERKAKGLPEEG